MLDTDAKTFINKKDFKTNNKNKPRVFANTINIKKEITTFEKVTSLSVITENDKCPPWAIQSSRMLHDRKKKLSITTMCIKIYDIPVFYSPKLSHPDPSVKKKKWFFSPCFSRYKKILVKGYQFLTSGQ